MVTVATSRIVETSVIHPETLKSQREREARQEVLKRLEQVRRDHMNPEYDPWQRNKTVHDGCTKIVVHIEGTDHPAEFVSVEPAALPPLLRPRVFDNEIPYILYLVYIKRYNELTIYLSRTKEIPHRVNSESIVVELHRRNTAPVFKIPANHYLHTLYEVIDVDKLVVCGNEELPKIKVTVLATDKGIANFKITDIILPGEKLDTLYPNLVDDTGEY